MKTDVEIAQEAKIKEITSISEKINLKRSDLELYGDYKAKIKSNVWNNIKNNENGKLILVTATNPTAAGEGKITNSIGIGDALSLLNYKTCIALREPSLGPCFGVKGGATGGGYAQVIPMEDINLHFTGDIHAITTAHNLLAAVIDNHIFQGNELRFDTKRPMWKRVVDLNDRALRNVMVGLGPRPDGIIRETGFDITVASEIMAILCLSNDITDLRNRIDNITVGYDVDNNPITCKMLGVTGSLVTLLKDAIKPNIVQTLEGTPVLIHGGPFANIAHGCNSIIATKHALKLADYVVTEAGFGADLGAEKFLDIKCPLLGKYPDAVVIVATIRALKLHGYVKKENLNEENVSALNEGFANLEKHIKNIQRYNLPVIVALNKFTSDTENEVNLVRERCSKLNVKLSISDVWEKGGNGGIDLAKSIVESINQNKETFNPLYSPDDSVYVKIDKLTKTIYGASEVAFEPAAKRMLDKVDKNEEFKKYPICVAKTQYSLSDDKKLLGEPKNFKMKIRDAKIMSGAGFVVLYAGDIMTMPGLPKHPAAENINIDDNGKITGLF